MVSYLFQKCYTSRLFYGIVFQRRMLAKLIFWSKRLFPNMLNIQTFSVFSRMYSFLVVEHLGDQFSISLSIFRFNRFGGRSLSRIYIYIYIYKYTYALNFKCFDIFEKLQKLFLMCSYIQNTTLNHIESFQLAIYKTNHTQNTNIHFQKSKVFKRTYFQKIVVRCNQCCPLIFMALSKTSQG